MAVLVLDLDGFARVGEVHGDVVGDRVLYEVARRLEQAARPWDTVARLGSDEFVVVCAGRRSPQERSLQGVCAEARALQDAVALPVDADGVEVRVTASVGIARSPDSAPEEVLRHAVQALERTAGHQGLEVFDADAAARSRERTELVQALRPALANRISRSPPPVVDLATGALAGVEALVRWRREGHDVPPGQFVVAAEETGLGPELDRWVLGRACHDAAALRASGVLPEGATLAVNVSGRSLGPGLVDTVREAAGEAGLPLAVLELEITEGALVRDLEAGRAVLRDVQALGVRVALDDFGTGWEQPGLPAAGGP